MTSPFCHSVGAVIKNSKGEYLMLYRLVKPIGLAMPAGHVESGEEPGDAIRREVLEETGIRAINMTRSWERFAPVLVALYFKRPGDCTIEKPPPNFAVWSRKEAHRQFIEFPTQRLI